MMSVKVYVSFKYKETIKEKLFYIIVMTLIIIAPISSFAEMKPDWVDGRSNSYPEKQYLIGVGYGETREIAEKDAYGAISRIFSANVSSISRDYERYAQVKAMDKTDTQEEMEIERITKVTTDKVLENVVIVEIWHDSEQKVYYALAIIDRIKAGNSLKEQIHSFDLQAEETVKRGREITDKTQKIKSMKGAIRILLRREAYNKDLRVINLSGLGIDSPISLSEISTELENFLKNDFSIGVEVTGEKGDDVKNAIIEGLNIQGFSVAKGNQTEDLSIKGEVEFKEVYIENPEFKFVRWTANFKLIDKSTRKVIGSINNSGKEGHLTIKDAEERALNRMKEDIANEVSKKLTDFIYGWD
ncbi:MAG: LPP20 family lipoprotein [Nitrospirota bacterium]|jgi:hypothetical protein